MRDFILGMRALPAIVMFAVSICAPSRLLAQGSQQPAPTLPPSSDQKIDLSALNSVILQLQSQMQELNAQLKELKAQQQASQAESAALRKELELTKSQLATLGSQPASPAAPASAATAPVETPAPSPSTEERLARLEENQQLADSKAAEQSQSKVESASKYRMRLSGIVLLNTYFNRGNVDNQEFPQLALAPFQSGGQSFSSAAPSAHPFASLKSDSRLSVRTSPAPTPVPTSSLILLAAFLSLRTASPPASPVFALEQSALIGPTLPSLPARILFSSLPLAPAP